MTVTGSALAAAPSSESFDWEAWRHLPVLDDGRLKPMDTLAWETARRLCNRVSFPEPETGQKLNPTALYLSMLLDWQGPREVDPHDRSQIRQAANEALHQPDKWDRAPLLRVDFLALREALGIAAGQKYISPDWLSKARIMDPASRQRMPFFAWIQQLAASKQDGFTTFETAALELGSKYSEYVGHRRGERLRVMPIKGDAAQQWICVADLLEANYDAKTDPDGKLRIAKDQFQKARTAYRNNNVAEFNNATRLFIGTVTSIGPQLGRYPDRNAIELEVSYNRWAPFRIAWVSILVAAVSLLLHSGTRWRIFYAAGLAGYAAGVLAMLAGFAMRLAISGRAPVTSMYESVAYVGLGAAVFGLVLALFYRKGLILTAAASVATVALVLADNCPAVLDPGIRPLAPVLRSNFWLVTHVMTITLSYATFALALAIGNITLAYYLFGSRNREAIVEQSTFTYKSLQVGVLLLALGTILGAVWADYSWGRFWGWDPKEVWALIALLGYLAVLHARYVGWVGQFGLAALSVVCFSLVVMAWYGVNFVLGAGLHSYGFGGGGQSYVYAALAVQFLFVALAAVRHSLGAAGPKRKTVTADTEPALQN